MSIILYIIGGVLAIIIVLAVIGWFVEVYESIRSLFRRKGATNRRAVNKTAEPSNMKSVKPSNVYVVFNSKQIKHSTQNTGEHSTEKDSIYE